MHTRLATASDTPNDTVPWLGPDDPSSGRRRVVAEDAGVLVAAAQRAQHPAHPRFDLTDLWCQDAEVGAAVLRELVGLGERPLLAASVPTSPRHAALIAAGAVMWDEVPASLIDPRRADVQEWITAHSAPVVGGVDVDPDVLLDAWTTMYELTHAPLGTAPHDELREQFAGMCGNDTFRGRVRAVVDAGTLLAVGTTFSVGDALMGMSEAVDPAHPGAASAMDAVLASLLAEAGTPMELDGHATFFHHATCWLASRGSRWDRSRHCTCSPWPRSECTPACWGVRGRRCTIRRAGRCAVMGFHRARRSPQMPMTTPAADAARRHGIHPAWPVAVVTAFALLSAAAFRSTTGVLMQPIEATTGWSRATTSGAASLNLVLYGIAAPFTAALMQVWGVRRTVSWSLVVVATASAATAIMTSPWQLWALWGVCIGLGTGSLALTFGTIVANRWFSTHRNMVTGVFSAATAAGQVLFVPLIARIAAGPGWKVAALVTAAIALLTALACAIWVRDWPADRGVLPLGGVPAEPVSEEESGERPLHATIRVLLEGLRRWPFWVLLLTFFVCGWSTNGIVVTHLIPAAHDHSMPSTMAASMIAIIGVFDVLGTIVSGWLTDRFDPRLLLAVYYLTRGVSLVFINGILGPRMNLPLWAWIVFYGLDWTATVPPTVDLCRRVFGVADSSVAFGWAYASHMVGAGIGASVSGILRSDQGSYAAAWIVTAVLCVAAALLPMTIRLRPEPPGEHLEPVVAM